MKKHLYIKTEVVKSPHWLGDRYWRHDITACGLKRQSDDYHMDDAKNIKDVTSIKCKKIIETGGGANAISR